MTDSTRTEIEMPDDRPPAFANALMRWAVTTPLTQRWVGQGVALLTFAGRRTGTIYEIPVSYHRDGDEVTIVTKRLRRW
ncbi:MAG TPA: nitroreductase/quinone reductase family protein [Acidimicrobiia bacterium]|nr:nitroreductase/quinone reductase family protein [Acidimicrobiia bacterium]